MDTNKHESSVGKTHPFIAVLSSVGFPLTLTLSLGERGQRGGAQVLSRTVLLVHRPAMSASVIQARLATVLLLTEGEGRGEEEAFTRPASRLSLKPNANS
jgi:hypothetical protein